MWYVCVTCGRSDFSTQGSLKQHRLNNKACKAKRERELGISSPCIPANGDFSRVVTSKKQKISHQRYVSIHASHGDVEEEFSSDGKEASSNEEEDNTSDIDLPAPFEYDSADDSEGPDTSILEQFRKFVDGNDPKIKKTRRPLDRRYQSAIRIMTILRKTDASLSTYKAVMEWHFRESGELRPHASLGSTNEYISHERLFNRLGPRYNMKKDTHNIRQVVLSSSGAKVKIVKCDFKACLESLLTDPRIVDNDYLFYKDDPTKSPPKNQNNLKYVQDINTGKAFIDTYRRLVKKPGKQVLLPIIFYIDAASTTQFAHLPINALKFTLGIFNRAARDRPYMWRTLGYVPVVLADDSKGKRTLAKSKHLDAPMRCRDLAEDEGIVTDDAPDTAQDLHTMLSIIMEEYQEFQDKGFVWDLSYRGKVWRGLEFIPYIHFVKCDTMEADKLCGSFTSRGIRVQQICRYCHCLTVDSDDPDVDIRLKTVQEIAELVKNEDVSGLKKLSQQNINNCWYPLRFGSHNGQGIHGSCPLELLHHIYLGIFKYIRDCFYANLGDSGKKVDEINGLATEIGNLFQRQSDRDMPKTKFGNGIQRGKLMATEYRGIMLILLAIIVTTEGKKVVGALKEGTLSGEEGIPDWILLLEILLMWDMWLKSDQMALKHVERAKKKHRYIMYLIRKVGNRTKGMGLKIMKFHGIHHMADDILNFGIPMNFDTGSDESGHKISKKAAKRTQKKKDTFDEQVAIRLKEGHLLDMAGVELTTGGTPWTYWERQSLAVPLESQVSGEINCLGGSKFTLMKATNGDGAVEFVCTSTLKNAKEMVIEEDFVKFLKGLYDEVGKYAVEPDIRSQYKDRHGNIFRGTNLFNGAVWRDWVLIDWGGNDGILPAKIWGFVDLKHLPRTNNIRYGGLQRLKPSLYAIVENAKSDKKPGWKSEIFTPIAKEYKKKAKDKHELVFYLADVADFHKPATVIPDVGGKINHYLLVKPRSEWKEMFEKWLERPYEKYPRFPKQQETQENYKDK